MMIKRPAIRYYGGKWKLAPWIIEQFPPHDNYLEPCGGGASVLLQKPRSGVELFNDVNDNIVNLFRVLRDHPAELLEKIKLTPWARSEYELAKDPTDCPVERARRYYCLLWMSISGSEAKSGWRNVKDYGGHNLTLYHDALPDIVNRLQGVQIENKDAIELVKKHSFPNTLIYFDPPYVQSERSHKKQYAHEVGEQFHIDAAGALSAHPGYVVVSGYDCELYRDIFAGWEILHRESLNNSGNKRIESLWLNEKVSRYWKDNAPAFEQMIFRI